VLTGCCGVCSSARCGLFCGGWTELVVIVIGWASWSAVAVILAGAFSARNGTAFWVWSRLYLGCLLGQTDVVVRVGDCWGLVGLFLVAVASLVAGLFVSVGCFGFVECGVSSVSYGLFLG